MMQLHHMITDTVSTGTLIHECMHQLSFKQSMAIFQIKADGN